MGSVTQRLCELFGAKSEPQVVAPPQLAPALPGMGFETLLATLLDEKLVLKWTDNHSTLLSYRRHSGTLTLRLQRAFCEAGVREASALAQLLRGKRGQTRILQAYLAERAQICAPPPKRRARAQLRARGAHHDLGAYFAALNAAHFAGQCTSDITWGRAASGGRRRRRSMQLGCYVQQLALIRIHPALDQGYVPDWVVRGVVFHEMLHEEMGTNERGSRRSMHPPAFRARERAYPDYARCVAWEKQHLGRLLAYRPSPRP